jgi:hypothetical protein
LDLTKANAQLLKVREQLTATYAEIQEAKDATFEETKKAKLLMVALQQETQVHRGLRALTEVHFPSLKPFLSTHLRTIDLEYARSSLSNYALRGLLR